MADGFNIYILTQESRRGVKVQVASEMVSGRWATIAPNGNREWLCVKRYSLLRRFVTSIPEALRESIEPSGSSG